MNGISKLCLSLLVLVKLCEPLLLSRLYAPRVKNRQKGFTGLVDIWGQSSFNKDYLNVLRDEDPRQRGGPNKRSGDKRAEILQREIKA